MVAALAAFAGRAAAAAARLLGQARRRRAELPAGAAGRGGGARRGEGHGSPDRAARVDAAGTDLPGDGERRAPISGPSPATSATGSASAPISPRCAGKRSAPCGSMTPSRSTGWPAASLLPPQRCCGTCRRWSSIEAARTAVVHGRPVADSGAAGQQGGGAVIVLDGTELVAVARGRRRLAQADRGARHRRDRRRPAAPRPRCPARRRGRSSPSARSTACTWATRRCSARSPRGPRRRGGPACSSPSSPIRSRW